jgi:hypothetical protein
MITLLKLRPYTGDVVAPSPNRGPRKAEAIKGIVLHGTEDSGNEALTLSWMQSPKSRVSCHLLVSRAGRVTRLVGDQQRAWHAGHSWWRGTSDVNSITLGIEIANRNDGEPFRYEQYRRVADIVAHYCRQGLSINDVVGHDQIAMGRKRDPLGWDWERFKAMVEVRTQTADDELTAPPLPEPVMESVPAVTVAAPRVTATPVRHASISALPKRILQSRTVWVNGLMVIACIGALIGDSLDLAFRLGITLPEHVTKWALFVVGIVNIIFRLRMTQPLTCSPNVYTAASRRH